MARFSLSFLAIFVIFAALVLSLPTKTDDLSPNGQLGLDNALGDITVCNGRRYLLMTYIKYL